MNFNPTFMYQMLALVGGALAVGAGVVYLIAENGSLLQFIADLQEGGSGSVGFIKD